MKEFDDKDLKILSKIQSGSGYANSYYREDAWCASCKKKKPRRAFVSQNKRTGAETVKHLCNKCRKRAKGPDSISSAVVGSVKHIDGPDNGSTYVNWMCANTDGEDPGCGASSDIIAVLNDTGRSNGLG